jgi:hypothetical protein
LMRAFTLDRERAFRVVCDWLDQQSMTPDQPAPGKPVRSHAA